MVPANQLRNTKDTNKIKISKDVFYDLKNSSTFMQKVLMVFL